MPSELLGGHPKKETRWNQKIPNLFYSTSLLWKAFPGLRLVIASVMSQPVFFIQTSAIVTVVYACLLHFLGGLKGQG
jgi:hypothetical protein